jgi:hypothetical protein
LGQRHSGPFARQRTLTSLLRPFASPACARAHAFGIGVGALLVVGSCTSTDEPSARDKQGEVNQRLLEELLESGTPTSVGVGEDDYFSEVAERFADDPNSGLEGPPAQPPATTDDFDSYEEPIPINPFLEFGERIVEYGDGRIMKPYPLPVGQGMKLHDIIVRYGDFEVFTAEAGTPQPLTSVALDLQEGWIVESWSNPRGPNLEAGKPISLGDMLFVTATPDLLSRVEDFINLFAATVRQIEIEAKIVEVTTLDSLDFGIRALNDTTPMLSLPSDTLVDAVDWSFPNSVDASSLFTLSAVHDGLIFNAVLEAVADMENVSIISRPKVAVREGARAEIVNTRQIPFFKIGGINNSGGFNATLEFRDVGVQMYVIPRVVGTNTVVLNIDIEASNETGSSVTFKSGGEEIANPIIALRRATTIVRLRPGQAVILGGLITERSVERERKMPFIGDIPIIGNFFKSRYTSKEESNVLFFIRPRILEGADLNRPFE